MYRRVIFRYGSTEENDFAVVSSDDEAVVDVAKSAVQKAIARGVLPPAVEVRPEFLSCNEQPILSGTLLGELPTANGEDVLIILQDGNAPQQLGVFVRSQGGDWPKVPEYILVQPRQTLAKALEEVDAELCDRTMWGRNPTDSVAHRISAGNVTGRRLNKHRTIADLVLPSGALIALEPDARTRWSRRRPRTIYVGALLAVVVIYLAGVAVAWQPRVIVKGNRPFFAEVTSLDSAGGVLRTDFLGTSARPFDESEPVALESSRYSITARNPSLPVLRKERKWSPWSHPWWRTDSVPFTWDDSLVVVPELVVNAYENWLEPAAPLTGRWSINGVPVSRDSSASWKEAWPDLQGTDASELRLASIPAGVYEFAFAADSGQVPSSWRVQWVACSEGVRSLGSSRFEISPMQGKTERIHLYGYSEQ